MKLTLKAQRFIAEASRDLPEGTSRDRLRSWVEGAPGREIPADVAVLALNALKFFERWLLRSIDSGRLTEDQQAEMINDVGYVRAIAVDLSRETGRTPVSV